jgi:hypothetical protein
MGQDVIVLPIVAGLASGIILVVVLAFESNPVTAIATFKSMRNYLDLSIEG